MDVHDLAARLDRSIGPAPEDAPPLPDLLSAGHRVVRRRRAFAAAASAVAAVAVVGSVALATGGGPERATPPVADEVTASPGASASPEIRPGTFGALLAEFATVGLVTNLDPAAVVSERLDDPLDLPAPGRSVAAAVTDAEGAAHWVLLYDMGGGWTGGAVTEAAEQQGTFSFWIAQQQVARSGLSKGESTDYLVRFVDGERLAPLPGVEIVEQRPGVDVGASFAGPDDDTVAAIVRDAAGELRFVLARRGVRLEPQFIAVSQADGGPDLDAFLDWARERYAKGEGGLL